MVRRLGLGKNNHLTYTSLVLNPRNAWICLVHIIKGPLPHLWNVNVKHCLGMQVIAEFFYRVSENLTCQMTHIISVNTKADKTHSAEYKYRQSQLQQTTFWISFYFSEKISRHFRQMIHMKCQNLFLSPKKKNRMSAATNFAWHFNG